MESQAQEQKHRYSPLDPESRQIRLFTLQPGAFNDPIKGFLSQATLEDEPDYEALSYSALRRIRLKDSPRRLWIDAICINQLDISERNHQVKNMKLVYQAASRVLAWLGELTVYSRQGLLELTELMTKGTEFLDEETKSMRRMHFCIRDITDRDCWRRIWVVQEVVLAKRVVLLCGPFSAELPTTECHDLVKRGTQEIEQMFKTPGRLSLTRLLYILRLREERMSSRVLSIWEIAWQFRHCKSHDPRDMVFALLGLAPNTDVEENKADYALTVDQVKIRFVRSYVLRYSNLRILNHIREGSNDPPWLSGWDRSELDHVWEELQATPLVPFESSQPSRFRAFGASKDCVSVLCAEKSLNPSVLTIQGFLVDDVDHLGGRYQYNPLSTKSLPITVLWGPDDIVSARVSYDGRSLTKWPKMWSWKRMIAQRRLLQDWKYQALSTLGTKQFTQAETSGPVFDRIKHAFWRTIMADSTTHLALTGSENKDAVNQVLQPTEKLTLSRTVEILTEDGLGEDLEELFHGEPFRLRFDDIVRTIEAAIGPRQFFLGKTGLVGLAPAAAAEGDIICVLLGGATPFVLRPTRNHHYKLIGECYVHGMMDGEAMDGLADGKYKLQDISILPADFSHF